MFPSNTSVFLAVRENPHLLIDTLCAVLSKLLKEATDAEEAEKQCLDEGLTVDVADNPQREVPVVTLLPPENQSGMQAHEQTTGRASHGASRSVSRQSQGPGSKILASNGLCVVGTQYGTEVLVSMTDKRVPAATTSGLYLSTTGATDSMLSVPSDGTTRRRKLKKHVRRQISAPSLGREQARIDIGMSAAVENRGSSAPVHGRSLEFEDSDDEQNEDGPAFPSIVVNNGSPLDGQEEGTLPALWPA